MAKRSCRQYPACASLGTTRLPHCFANYAPVRTGRIQSGAGCPREEVSMVETSKDAGGDSSSSVTMREQIHGARYGEVLLITGRLNHIEATVYNTLGLNDCPDDLWRALDPDAIKKEYGARAVVLNGPRYFLMDKVSIANPGTEIFNFGGLQMRRLATVPLKLTSVLGGIHRHPYSEQPI